MIEQTLAQNGLVSIISHLIFIVITWQVVQSLNFDELFRKKTKYLRRGSLSFF